MMKPIFHLSIPVARLDEAIEFYTGTLGASVGRTTERFADLWLFGTQLTLHEDAAGAGGMPRAWHFGATLPWPEWSRLAEALSRSGTVVHGPTHAKVGEPAEERKIVIQDPSGNLIELKSYRDPARALGREAAASAGSPFA